MSNTPRTEMVRAIFAIGRGGLSDDVEAVRAEAFDRWLAAEKAKWQAEALREAARELAQQGTEPWNRNSVEISTLQFRADHIEKGVRV